MNTRTLAEMFRCGRTQIAHILENKQAILSLFESNTSGRKIHSTKIAHVSEFEEVNRALYEWNLLASSKNIFRGGPQLTEKAKQIAE